LLAKSEHENLRANAGCDFFNFKKEQDNLLFFIAFSKSA